MIHSGFSSGGLAHPPHDCVSMKKVKEALTPMIVAGENSIRYRMKNTIQQHRGTSIQKIAWIIWQNRPNPTRWGQRHSV
jgi:hypothetical protein